MGKVDRMRHPTCLFGELDQESPGDPCVRFHLRRLREGLRGVDLVMTEK